MSLDALRAELDGTADLPLEEAVPRIATALNGQLLTAQDNEGVAWIYAYTGDENLLSEVKKNLTGPARIEAIADILSSQDPGDYNRDG